MNAINQQIHDDVQEIRDELPAPYRRRYTLMVKSEELRLVFDEDVSFTFSVPVDKVKSHGYEFEQADFAKKTLVFKPGVSMGVDD